MDAQLSWGNFYTGKNTALETSLGWNFTRRINFSADWERNYIQIGNTDFTTNEIGGRFEYAFSNVLVSSLFGQWNNEDEKVLLNFRVNWIPQSGSYFYFVINQEYATANGVKLINTTVLSKLVWLFAR